MRLEQIPKLKTALERKLDEVLAMGTGMTAVRWSVEVVLGEAKLHVEIAPEFDSMRDPHDPEKPISRDQLAQVVTGSYSVGGRDEVSTDNIKPTKRVLMEDDS